MFNPHQLHGEVPVFSDTREIDGYAQCNTPHCRERSDLRPIKLTVTTTSRGYEGLPKQFIESTHEHVAPANHSDLYCPECGMPSAILTGKPIDYPHMGYGTAA